MNFIILLMPILGFCENSIVYETSARIWVSEDTPVLVKGTENLLTVHLAPSSQEAFDNRWHIPLDDSNVKLTSGGRIIKKERLKAKDKPTGISRFLINLDKDAQELHFHVKEMRTGPNDTDKPEPYDKDVTIDLSKLYAETYKPILAVAKSEKLYPMPPKKAWILYTWSS